MTNSAPIDLEEARQAKQARQVREAARAGTASTGGETLDAASRLDLDAIKGRVERAMPGPWVLTERPWGGQPWRISRAATRRHPELYVAEVSQDCPEGYAYDNASFLAHAREDVASLVAEVERLRARLRTREAAAEALAQAA